MNIVFTQSALMEVGLSRLVKLAQENINKHAEDAGNSVTLIFEDRIANAQVGSMVRAIMKANPKCEFAMVSGLSVPEIQQMLDEVYDGEGNIVVRLVDQRLINILN